MDPSPGAAGLPDVESHFNTGLERHRLQDALRRHAGDPEGSGDGRPARYAFEGELGRGGMGVVYRVRDLDLQRTLAMKVAGAGEEQIPVDPALLTRFLDEAQVTGQLDHPGIVPLHELGIDPQGRVYFTMRLVKGQHLGEVIRLVRAGSPEWTLERALGVLVKACEAMAYAHSKGVVHRDLKPANVMTGRFGEAYVMDWGLAKVRGRATGPPPDAAQTARSVVRVAHPGEGAADGLVTMHGAVFGTPLYMAPEQARGQVDQVDQRSDVYSMGALLYHLLAGHPPYVPPDTLASASTVLQWVIEGAPRPLREAAPRAPADLAAICERAMSREPADRYQDMLPLAEDLRRYLQGRPVSANPLSALTRTLRWSRRNPVVAGFLIALSLATAVGFWSLSGLTTELVHQAAIESARTEARMLEDVNILYSEAIVKRVVDAGGVPVTHDFANVPGAIPLPATFLTTLAEKLSAHGGGNFVRHFSEAPFRFRADGGARDEYERAALAHLKAEPATAYVRFEDVNGVPSLRYAAARTMKQSCVDCHNSHPDSPRHDWKVGDVRGVLEIVRPLDQDIERRRTELAGTFALVGGLGVGLLLLSAFLLVRQSRSAH